MIGTYFHDMNAWIKMLTVLLVRLAVEYADANKNMHVKYSEEQKRGKGFPCVLVAACDVGV